MELCAEEQEVMIQVWGLVFAMLAVFLMPLDGVYMILADDGEQKRVILVAR